MNRRLTALLAAFESLLVAAIGVAIPLAPLTVVWAAQYGFGPDWWVFWRAAVDVWLVGHGVDLSLALHPDTAAALGIPGAETPFGITIAALGFALLTALLGTRAGRRIAETPHRLLGELVALAAFAALALGVTLSSQYPFASPSVWQGALLPTAVYAVGVLIGSTRERLRNPSDEVGSSLRDWIGDWPPVLRAGADAALRGGAAAAAAVVGIASVLTATMIVIHYAEVISLYEAAQAGALGGIAFTVAQLAFVPNFVIWATTWLIGPGFALGAGSTVSPLGTHLGPIPALPVFGALPTGELGYGFLGLLVPVLAGFASGVIVRGRVAGESWSVRLAAGAGIGVIGGALLGLLAWASAGSAGPGRLVQVGPDPLAVALWAGLEIGVAACLGIASGAIGGLAGRPRAGTSA